MGELAVIGSTGGGQRLSRRSGGTESAGNTYRSRRARKRGGKRGGEGDGIFRVPRGLMSEHGVEHDDEFAHAGGERDLRFLARRKQSRVKGAQDRIAASGDQCAHIEHGTNLGATAPNRTCTTELAAVVVERRYSYQGRDLSSAERAELRQVGQK